MPQQPTSSQPFPPLCSSLEEPGRGVFRIAWLRPDAPPVALGETPNTWSYSWADAGVRLFTTGAANYVLSRMLVEYVNLTAPGTTVTPPSASRNDGVGYYLGLANSAAGDYLRLPFLAAPTVDLDAAGAGAPYLAHGAVNRLTCQAVVPANATGVNGKPFGAASYSLIVGLAVVAAPVPTSPAADVLCFRGYYAQSAQVPAASAGSLVVTYQATFN